MYTVHPTSFFCMHSLCEIFKTCMTLKGVRRFPEINVLRHSGDFECLESTTKIQPLITRNLPYNKLWDFFFNEHEIFPVERLCPISHFRFASLKVKWVRQERLLACISEMEIYPAKCEPCSLCKRVGNYTPCMCNVVVFNASSFVYSLHPRYMKQGCQK